MRSLYFVDTERRALTIFVFSAQEREELGRKRHTPIPPDISYGQCMAATKQGRQMSCFKGPGEGAAMNWFSFVS